MQIVVDFSRGAGDDRRARTSRTRTSASTAPADQHPQAEGAKECAVELYSMNERSRWPAGVRICRATRGVQALVKEELSRLWQFQPVQIAATVAMNEAADYPRQCVRSTRVAASPDRRARSHRLGHPQAEGIDVLWRDSPSRIQMDSVEFCSHVCARVRGRVVARRRLRTRRRGFARFALIENEQRIAQGIRNLKKGLPKLG